MDPVITTAIEKAYFWYGQCDGVEDLEESMPILEESIPIWDYLTDRQQLEAVEYVFKNEHDEDFGHSGCCKAIHQATAYYCVRLLQESDSGAYFDDLDFMTCRNIRSNPAIQKLFGISEDF